MTKFEELLQQLKEEYDNKYNIASYEQAILEVYSVLLLYWREELKKDEELKKGENNKGIVMSDKTSGILKAVRKLEEQYFDIINKKYPID